MHSNTWEMNMLLVFVMPVVVLGCAVAGVVLTALYFTVGLALAGLSHGNGVVTDALAASVAANAGRLAFTFGAPAGALIGLFLGGPIADALVHRGLAKDSRVVAWVSMVPALALAALIFIVPLYSSLLDSLKLLSGRPILALFGLGYLFIVQRIMQATELSWPAKAHEGAAARDRLAEPK
jgi:hypothetical protein